MPIFNVLKAFTSSSSSRRQQSKPDRSLISQDVQENYLRPSPERAEEFVDPEHWQTTEMVEKFQFQSGASLHGRVATDAYSVNRNIPANSEAVESTRSWSPIPSVYRESARPEEHPSDHHELLVAPWQPANRRDTWVHGLRGRIVDTSVDQYHPVPEQIAQATSALDETRYRQESFYHHDGSLPSIPHTGYAVSGNFEAEKQPSVDVVHKYGNHGQEHEIIEPVIYEHEVWSDGDDGDGDGVPELYHYIVPGGMNVIFQDEHGNEITRVGEFGKSINKPRRVSPTIVQDEYGTELYRTGDFRTLERSYNHRTAGNRDDRHAYAHSSHGMPVNGQASRPNYASHVVAGDATNVILIDDQGRQIAIKRAGWDSVSSERSGRTRGRTYY